MPFLLHGLCSNHEPTGGRVSRLNYPCHPDCSNSPLLVELSTTSGEGYYLTRTSMLTADMVRFSFASFTFPLPTLFSFHFSLSIHRTWQSKPHPPKQSASPSLISESARQSLTTNLPHLSSSPSSSVSTP